MKKKLEVIVTITVKDPGGSGEYDIQSKQVTKYQCIVQPCRALQIQSRIDKLIGNNNMYASTLSLRGDKQ